MESIRNIGLIGEDAGEAFEAFADVNPPVGCPCQIERDGGMTVMCFIYSDPRQQQRYTEYHAKKSEQNGN